MSRHIDRLRAERDLRSLNVQAAAAALGQGSSEVYNDVRANLLEQIGISARPQEEVTSHEDKLAFLLANS